MHEITRNHLIHLIVEKATEKDLSTLSARRDRGARRAAVAAGGGVMGATQVAGGAYAIKGMMGSLRRGAPSERSFGVFKGRKSAKGKVYRNTMTSMAGGGGAFDPSDNSVHFSQRGKKMSGRSRFMLGHEFGHRKNWSRIPQKLRAPAMGVRNIGGSYGSIAGVAGAAIAKKDSTAKKAAIVGTVAAAPMWGDEMVATGRSIGRHVKKYGAKGLKQKGFGKAALASTAVYTGMAAAPALAYGARRAYLKATRKKK
jgi:hypothetical protein